MRCLLHDMSDRFSCHLPFAAGISRTVRRSFPDHLLRSNSFRMFKGLFSFFGRAFGGQGGEETHAEPPVEKKSTFVFVGVLSLDTEIKEKGQPESTTIVAKSEKKEKVKSNLPDLPPIDTLIDFVSAHTIS